MTKTKEFHYWMFFGNIVSLFIYVYLSWQLIEYDKYPEPIFILALFVLGFMSSVNIILSSYVKIKKLENKDTE